MPSLMLRALSPELVERVRAFARGRGLSLVAGAVELLEAGLERRQSQSAGGQALRDQTPPEVRQARARAAARARWDVAPD
jgi:hypothetical protein